MKRATMVMVGVAAVMGACEKKSPPPPPAAPKATSSAPAPRGSDAPAIPGVSPGTSQRIADAASEAKSKLVNSLEAGISEATTRLNELEAKVKTASEEKKPEMQAALDRMRAKYGELTRNLADLRGKAGTEWDRLSAETKQSYDDLQKSISDFAAKYR
jgi:hypothetical protein